MAALSLAQLWLVYSGHIQLVHELSTLTMAAWQPNLGAREGLEPLESTLEECRGRVKWFDIK